VKSFAKSLNKNIHLLFKKELDFLKKRNENLKMIKRGKEFFFWIFFLKIFQKIQKPLESSLRFYIFPRKSWQKNFLIFLDFPKLNNCQKKFPKNKIFLSGIIFIWQTKFKLRKKITEVLRIFLQKFRNVSLFEILGEEQKKSKELFWKKKIDEDLKNTKYFHD